VTDHAAKQWAAKQIARSRTLRRALYGGHEEDRVRVVHGIVRRLPIPVETKQKVLDWCIGWILDRQKSAARAGMQKAQADWNARGQRRLNRLLSSDEVLEVPPTKSPVMTFISVAKEKAHLTVLSLESVIKFADVTYELIVVDNASADSTLAMLERFKGAKIIRNLTNVGFGPACMQAADIATGHYLCFLNNDALLTRGAVPAMLRNFEHEQVGAVGAKVLLANGALQEAGSIIWSDGSALGYGRGADPDLPQYNFRRPVDYCSGVFLVTPRELFQKLGGFSEEFAPAYYEDTDYCMTLWHNGWHVIYEPMATILHYESASSGGNEHATARMAAHQVKFKEKWGRELEKHYPPALSNVCAARFAVQDSGMRIVYVDDRVPKRTLGAGFPRSNDIVSGLAGMGHHVVCSTSTFPLLSDNDNDLPREVEAFDGYRFREKLVNRYMACADIVWVSRPHNMKRLLQEFPEGFSSRRFALVYDAEAIFAPRVRARNELVGAPHSRPSPLEPTGLDEEVALAKRADAVVVVSEADREVMLESGVKSVHVVGHVIAATPTPASFEERDAFLFIGAVHGSDNPNADSIRAFYQKQWTRIHRETRAVFLVAGFGTEILNNEIADPTFQILGRQDDLRPLYDRARVFVVPTRYAAGIPFKAHEAAGYGVPMVVSPVIDRQLQWSHGTDYFAASDLDQMAEYCIQLYKDRLLWQRLRTNSLARVASELSPSVFAEGLLRVIKEVTLPKQTIETV
jgi:GT2 family glycosyltransferase/glycosyltransferase involved in cell wall biosynthesis